MTEKSSIEKTANHPDAGSPSLQPWMANGILYVLDIPAFRDGNGDGIGDIQGVRDALDDLAGLGISALWLLPFYGSPRRDNGYDVADHFTVDSRLGTLDDFRGLIEDAHRRDIRIIIDLLANHTSTEHPWFKSAINDPSGPTHDHYVWTTTPDKYSHRAPVFPGFEDSVWQYEPSIGAWYMHNFYRFEADLNSDHPAVRNYVHDVVTFWLELGVDGFRLDAAPFLGSDLTSGTPDPHDYLKLIRQWIDAVNPNACLLAEADLPTRDLSSYFGQGDEVHALFDFMLNRSLFLAMAEQSAASVRTCLIESPPARAGQGWVGFLRHHDELSLSFLEPDDQQKVLDFFAPHPSMRIYERGIRRRLAPLLKNDWGRMRWIFSLLLSLPAVPMINYGDEIGLQENLALPERAAVRTPMLWPDQGATPSHLLLPNIVSKVAAPIPVPPPANLDGSGAFRTWLADAIRLRKRVLSDRQQGFELLDARNAAVLVHRYPQDDGASLLCLHNFSDQLQTLALDCAASVRSVLLAPPSFSPPRSTAELQIAAHGYMWLLVDDAADADAPQAGR